MRPSPTAGDFARELWREMREDRVTGLAAELAFFGLLALFPGFIAVTAALGSLGSLVGEEAATEVRDEVVSFLEGAVVATFLWLAATLGLRAYLAIAADANQIFGSLGGALIVLVWLHLLGLSVLGGEVNAILAARNRVPQPGQD